MIIGFTGLARAGKTTAARRLLEQLDKQGLPVEFLSFATPVKAAVEAIGLSRERDGHIWRQAAQVIGHEMRNQVKMSFWVDLMKERMADHRPGTIFVIDDVRYGNELALCDTKIYIDASKRLDLREPVYAHSSEQLAREVMSGLHDGDTNGMVAAAKMDHIIDNNGAKPDFYKSLDDLFSVLLQGAAA